MRERKFGPPGRRSCRAYKKRHAEGLRRKAGVLPFLSEIRHKRAGFAAKAVPISSHMPVVVNVPLQAARTFAKAGMFSL